MKSCTKSIHLISLVLYMYISQHRQFTIENQEKKKEVPLLQRVMALKLILIKKMALQLRLIN